MRLYTGGARALGVNSEFFKGEAADKVLSRVLLLTSRLLTLCAEINKSLSLSLLLGGQKARSSYNALLIAYNFIAVLREISALTYLFGRWLVVSQEQTVKQENAFFGNKTVRCILLWGV